MSEAKATKHSPGPWTEERETALSRLGMDPDRLCVEIQSNGRTIGYWVPCEWDGRCPDSQLIAAAPAILKALEGIVWFAEHCFDRNPNMSPAWLSLEAAAKNAISKAVD